MRTTPWILATAVAALLLTGCGAASSYHDSVGLAAPPGTELGLVVPASSSGSAAVTVPSPGSITGPGSNGPTGGGNATAFCTDVRSLQAALTTLSLAGAPASGRAQALAALLRLERHAPAALRGAVRTFRPLETRIVRDLTTQPPDISDYTATVADPAYLASAGPLVRYAVTRCRIILTPAS